MKVTFPEYLLLCEGEKFYNNFTMLKFIKGLFSSLKLQSLRCHFRDGAKVLTQFLYPQNNLTRKFVLA